LTYGNLLLGVAAFNAIIVEFNTIDFLRTHNYSGFRALNAFMTPIMIVMPLLLCVSFQFGIRKWIKDGKMTGDAASRRAPIAPTLAMITYVAIGMLIRLFTP
jgi:hypothetical protein